MKLTVTPANLCDVEYLFFIIILISMNCVNTVENNTVKQINKKCINMINCI